ncbi:MAG: hypothetical protein V3T77_01125 [Planctomycetota bacterium]
MKAKPKEPRRVPGDLFALAEAVSLLYGYAGTEGVTEEFQEIAGDYRTLKKSEGQEEWLMYILQLLLACPVLLERPAGLEWVTDDLQWALQHRKWDPEVDRDFWRALSKVRELLTRGRPGSRAKDLLRHQMVYGMMNPITTVPGKGLARTKGINKTAAVEKVADLEERIYGRKPEQRVIWRSLRRVDQYLAKIGAQVERTKGSARHCPN